jgi:hypothetical protein
MPVYEQTAVYGLPKPHPTNRASEDVARLRTALDMVDSQLDRLEKVRNTSVRNLVNKQTVVFDRTIMHTKTSLIGTTNAKVDPDDPSKSQWVLVFGPNTPTLSVREGAAALVHLTMASVIQPGYYESPVRYALDKNQSFIQLVVANTQATSAEINARLAATNVTARNVGSWNSNQISVVSPIVQIAGRHPYTSLFARFVNGPAIAGATPQEIHLFGGNSNFAVNTIEYFNNINYTDVL